MGYKALDLMRKVLCGGQKMRLRRGLTCSFVMLIALASCQGGKDQDAFLQPVKFDSLRPIAAESFAEDLAIQQQILLMPFAVVQERLGTFKLQADSAIELIQESKPPFLQQDHYELTADLQGNYYALLQTPHSKIELSSLPEYSFSRINDGQVHRALKREMADEELADVVVASRLGVFELFSRGLSFTRQGSEMIAGREALKFVVSWTPEKNDERAALTQAVETSLPKALRGKWREEAERKALEGAVWLDRASGVWSKAELEGQLLLAEEGMEPMTIKVTYAFVIEGIAERVEIEIPKNWRNRKLLNKQLDPLAFFREHMPEEESEQQEKQGQ